MLVSFRCAPSASKQKLIMLSGLRTKRGLIPV